MHKEHSTSFLHGFQTVLICCLLKPGDLHEAVSKQLSLLSNSPTITLEAAAALWSNA